MKRKYVKYRENYPHAKGLANIFAKFSPSEYNHVYSMCKIPILIIVMKNYEREWTDWLHIVAYIDLTLYWR